MFLYPSVDPPRLCPVRPDNSRTVKTVKMSLEIPLFGPPRTPARTNHSRTVHAVKLAILIPCQIPGPRANHSRAPER